MKVIWAIPSALSAHYIKRPDICPNIHGIIEDGTFEFIDSVFPALAASTIATMLSGTYPAEHGIVQSQFFSDADPLLVYDGYHRLQRKFFWVDLREQKGLRVAAVYVRNAKGSQTDFIACPSLNVEDWTRLSSSHYFVPASLRDEVSPVSDGQKDSVDWIVKCVSHLTGRYDPELIVCGLPCIETFAVRLGPFADDTYERVKLLDANIGMLVDLARSTGRAIVISSDYAVTPVEHMIDLKNGLKDAGFHSSVSIEGQVAFITAADDETPSEIASAILNVGPVEILATEDEKASKYVNCSMAGDIVAIAPKDSCFISPEASMPVFGSHGRLSENEDEKPVFISSVPVKTKVRSIMDVHKAVLELLGK